MTKRLYILFLICIWLMPCTIQAQRYSYGYSQYQQNYMRLYYLAESHLNTMSDVINSALTENIDGTLRNQLLADYQQVSILKNSLHLYGLSQGLISSIEATENTILAHLSAYEKRQNQNRRIKELERIQRYIEDTKKKEQENQLKDKSGTGFALNQDYLVTNYHVVEDANIILVKGIDGDFELELLAKVVATDKPHDIAILQIIDDRFKGFGRIPYKIKQNQADVGESIWTLGYPLIAVMGDEIKFTDGRVSSKTGLRGDNSMYQITVPIQPGNSGGPLFDEGGNIIGITCGQLNKEFFNSENVNFAIKSGFLCHLIDSCSLSTKIIPQGTAMQGLTLTQKIKFAQKYVFMIICSTDITFHSDKLPQGVAENYIKGEGYVDLGLPSGTLWKKQNEKGLFSYDEAILQYQDSMPSVEQWQELKSLCKWFWQGNGYSVKGPNENTIFLPSEGFRYCSGSMLKNGSYGTYWSSSPAGAENAWYITFSSEQLIINNINRCGGRSIRFVK